MISAWLGWEIDAEGRLWGTPLLVLLGYGALMTAVCSLACVVPVRRALAVEPNEALSRET